MKIDIANLQNEVVKYKTTVTKYEECMNDLYGVFMQTSSAWKDLKEERFIKNITTEKMQMEEIVRNLTSINRIYDYILDKYGKFGKKIDYELSQKDKVLENFERVINAINKTISSYENLNLSFGPSEKYKIIEEKNRLIKVRDNVSNLKYKVKNVFEELEEIEKEVNHKIASVKVTMIKESNIEDYI